MLVIAIEKPSKDPSSFVAYSVFSRFQLKSYEISCMARVADQQKSTMIPTTLDGNMKMYYEEINECVSTLCHETHTGVQIERPICDARKYPDKYEGIIPGKYIEMGLEVTSRVPAADRYMLLGDIIFGAALPRLDNPAPIPFCTVDRKMVASKCDAVTDDTSHSIPWRISGKDITSYIKSNKSQVWYLLLQCVKAVELLHNHKFVHGDIQPSNFFVRVDDKGVPLVRLGNFVSGCYVPNCYDFNINPVVKQNRRPLNPNSGAFTCSPTSLPRRYIFPE